MKKNLIPHSLFLNLSVFLAINVGLIWLDWSVLSSLFKTFSNEDTNTITSGTLVLAIAIDATVMLIGHIVASRFRAAVLSKICVVSLILAFSTAAVGMGCMRLMNADTIFEAADVGSSEDKDYFAKSEESAPAGSEASSESGKDGSEAGKADSDSGMKRLNLFTQILFTLSPIFTSVVAFCLSCLRSHYKLKLDIQKLERHIEELNAEALAIKNAVILNDADYHAHDDGADSRRLIMLNDRLAEVDNYNQRLKGAVREIYMSYCRVPEHVHYARSIAVTASPAYYPTRLTASVGCSSPAPAFFSGEGHDLDETERKAVNDDPDPDVTEREAVGEAPDVEETTERDEGYEYDE